MEEVSAFEAGIRQNFNARLRKIYLSVDKKTQAERLEERKRIMKRWKSSMVDAQAQEKWGEYTFAKKRVLELTHTPKNPWHVVDSTVRYLAVIECIKILINTFPDIADFVSEELKIDLAPNPEVMRL